MPAAKKQKKLRLPVVLAVIVVGGAVTLANCGDGKPNQDAEVTDGGHDAAPDTPIV